jgi:hypothetical protein
LLLLLHLGDLLCPSCQLDESLSTLRIGLIKHLRRPA